MYEYNICIEIRRKRGQIQLVLSYVESHATASVQQRDAFRIRDDAEQGVRRGEFFLGCGNAIILYYWVGHLPPNLCSEHWLCRNQPSDSSNFSVRFDFSMMCVTGSRDTDKLQLLGGASSFRRVSGTRAAVHRVEKRLEHQSDFDRGIPALKTGQAEKRFRPPWHQGTLGFVFFSTKPDPLKIIFLSNKLFKIDNLKSVWICVNVQWN